MAKSTRVSLFSKPKIFIGCTDTNLYVGDTVKLEALYNEIHKSQIKNMAGKESVVEGFVTNIQQNLWLAVNEKYETALNIRSQKLKADTKKALLDLDKWYQNELPEIIQARSEKYITKDELCKLMKWKLTRGKFRPRLTELVQTNTDSEVEEASKKAFKKLPNLDKAINDLTVLKAIGPATASAVLAAGAPEHAAFMADESMMALPGLQPISYNLRFYLMYMDQVKAIVRKLNEQVEAIRGIENIGADYLSRMEEALSQNKLSVHVCVQLYQAVSLAICMGMEAGVTIKAIQGQKH